MAAKIPYTNEEISYIKQCLNAGMNTNDILPQLQKMGNPNRTHRGLTEKIRAMGLTAYSTKRSWTKVEDGYIFRYRNYGAKYIVNELHKNGYTHRNKNGVLERASHLNISIKRNRMNAWNAEELEILKKYYPFAGCPAVFAALKQKGYNRSRCGISSKASELKIPLPPEKRYAQICKVNKGIGMAKRIKQGQDLHALNI